MKIKLHDFEEEAIACLRRHGYRVRILPVSAICGVKTADIEIDGQQWEIKCPSKVARSTLEHAFAAAMKQSANLIFDLRRIKTKQNNAGVEKICRMFGRSKKAKRLKIITKSGELLEFES